MGDDIRNICHMPAVSINCQAHFAIYKNYNHLQWDHRPTKHSLYHALAQIQHMDSVAYKVCNLLKSCNNMEVLLFELHIQGESCLPLPEFVVVYSSPIMCPECLLSKI
uniref:Uncharacterized protein n=1 Tax=Arundo donax TaxID=35708 RepID=A0A0A9GBW8_ARUDO